MDYTFFYNNIDYLHIKREKPKSQFQVDFHLHDEYEILFLISGDVNYFVENKFYKLNVGDIIITNNLEIHKPSIYSDKPYERITVHINSNLVDNLSSDKYSLNRCFVDRKKGEHNKIVLNPEQLLRIKELFQNIELMKSNQSNGSDVLGYASVIEMLVLINRAHSSVSNHKEYTGISSKLKPILVHIDKNLDSDLRLDTLEKIFFINKFYLSKQFKNITGSTLQDYIIYKRISRAKSLLVEGLTVSDVCEKSGFNDYSHFIRTFKNKVGISPGKYKRTIEK